MHTSRLFEIEFAPQADCVDAANRAVANLANHLELTQYRVEPLVRVGEGLVNPWTDEGALPKAFAYRIHFSDVAQGDWVSLRTDFLKPLAQQGVAFREVRLAA